MNYLFPNFLTNIDEFKKAKNYWHSLCQDVLIKNHQLEFWETWFESNRHNIELSDNFPICSLINRERTKGVIINQQDPQVHTKWETVAYTEEYVREDDELWASQYLVFNCNLTEKTAELFRKLFDTWIQLECSRENIEELIKILKIQ